MRVIIEDKDKLKNLPPQDRSRLMFAQMLKQVKYDIDANRQTRKKLITTYTKEDISKYLESPERYGKELRDVTKSLCVISPQFNRLVRYLPDMALFRYMVIPNTTDVSSNDKIQKNFISGCEYMRKLNIENEFRKIIQTNFKYDAFYGYCIEDKNSFYIKQLDNNYCKIVSRVDGNFCFAFDFSYFDANDNSKFLPMYPLEFRTKYNIFKTKGYDYKWQMLEPENTICTKFYDDMPDITFPPYCNLFGDLYDINDYKQLDKQKAENENYHLIGLQLETNSKDLKSNSFTVDPDLASDYYEIIQESMPDGVGVFLSPVKWDSVDFNSDNTNNLDRVQNSTRNFWDGAGVSAVLFNSGSSTAGTLEYSMLVDTNMLYGIYRQLETWLNTRLYSNFKNKVRVKLFDVTQLNKEKYQDEFLKMCQYGLPVKMSLSSLMGFNPIDTMDLCKLENDILELHDKFIPLSSSHTQSSSDDGGSGKTEDNLGGRPQEEATDLKESGEQTRDSGANDNR